MRIRNLIDLEILKDCEGYTIVIENQTGEEEFNEISGKEIVILLDHRLLKARFCLINTGTPFPKKKGKKGKK